MHFRRQTLRHEFQSTSVSRVVYSNYVCVFEAFGVCVRESCKIFRQLKLDEKHITVNRIHIYLLEQILSDSRCLPKGTSVHTVIPNVRVAKEINRCSLS